MFKKNNKIFTELSPKLTIELSCEVNFDDGEILLYKILITETNMSIDDVKEACKQWSFIMRLLIVQAGGVKEIAKMGNLILIYNLYQTFSKEGVFEIHLDFCSKTISAMQTVSCVILSQAINQHVSHDLWSALLIKRDGLTYMIERSLN